METIINIFFNESDIRKIVKQHIAQHGHKQVGDLEIITGTKVKMVTGAKGGDTIAMTGMVKKI